MFGLRACGTCMSLYGARTPVRYVYIYMYACMYSTLRVVTLDLILLSQVSQPIRTKLCVCIVCLCVVGVCQCLYVCVCVCVCVIIAQGRCPMHAQIRTHTHTHTHTHCSNVYNLSGLHKACYVNRLALQTRNARVGLKIVSITCTFSHV